MVKNTQQAGRISSRRPIYKSSLSDWLVVGRFQACSGPLCKGQKGTRYDSKFSSSADPSVLRHWQRNAFVSCSFRWHFQSYKPTNVRSTNTRISFRFRPYIPKEKAPSYALVRSQASFDGFCKIRHRERCHYWPSFTVPSLTKWALTAVGPGTRHI